MRRVSKPSIVIAFATLAIACGPSREDLRAARKAEADIRKACEDVRAALRAGEDLAAARAFGTKLARIEADCSANAAGLAAKALRANYVKERDDPAKMFASAATAVALEAYHGVRDPTGDKQLHLEKNYVLEINDFLDALIASYRQAGGKLHIDVNQFEE